MYYQNYEDYMRRVLGYPIENVNTYGMEKIVEPYNNNMMYQDTSYLEDYYPEIYKMINPIVCEVCNKNINARTREDIEDMVDEAYQKVMANNEIAVKVNLDNRSISKEENRLDNVKIGTNKTINVDQLRQTKEVENRQRRPNNPLLRDLIRILILNRLLGGYFPARPPQPRPPFPGGPGRPGGGMPRPQMRNYEEYYKF